MAKYLLNGFSFNMMGDEALIECYPYPENLSVSEASELAKGAVSAVGHKDTAAVFQTVLGVPVAFSRIDVVLNEGDQVLVGQYRGSRLPEGTTTLPEGAKIIWLLVTIKPK